MAGTIARGASMSLAALCAAACSGSAGAGKPNTETSLPPSTAAEAGVEAGQDAGSQGMTSASPLDGGEMTLAPESGVSKASFPAVDDFGKPGPFATTSEVTDASCTVYRPMMLGEGGLLHPVILWGNGTGAPTVEVYAGFFKQWASHGFIVAAAHTATAGSGQEMLACLDWLRTQNTSADGAYAGHVDLANVGASGHSQGGGGTVMVGGDPRVRVTVPLQAWTGNSPNASTAEAHQTGPMFLISGTADVIAPPEQNQKPIFEASNVPTFWGTLSGGDHVTVALGTVDKYLAPTTAWFRLQLMADESARSMFYGPDCGLCKNPDWMVQRKHMD